MTAVILTRRTAASYLAFFSSWMALTACGPSGDSTSVWAEPSDSPSAVESSLDAALSAAPSPSSSPSPTASPSTSTTTAKTYQYAFPVVGNNSYAETHHDYPASDIIANCGLTIRAVTNGTVLEVSRVDRFDKSDPQGEYKGGLFVSILGDDGVRYYSAHMSAVTDGIEAGVRVTAAQTIGKVGSTGNSGACHVHFAISPPCAKTGDWWVRRGVVYPWSYLDSWKAGGTKSPVSEVLAWQKENGCPATAPSD